MCGAMSINQTDDTTGSEGGRLAGLGEEVGERIRNRP